MSIEIEMQVDARGNKRWYIKGTKTLHREDGPAVELRSGTQKWYINDKLHREDGPAIVYTTGYGDWYINDQQLNKRQVAQLKARLKTKFNPFFQFMSGQG